ncbi:hypothetical protein LSTR_LSTR009209 [Laodelphax striatellus]|uniref:Uncharacterized protein n=1 Tax=Laodelphax striatellus TaxID=195883 RepID=A0A482WQK2_LAOST|nr:hypothetical protein LSTR_LSTR009209 [Laodelphax striatellus]
MRSPVKALSTLLVCSVWMISLSVALPKPTEVSQEELIATPTPTHTPPSARHLQQTGLATAVGVQEGRGGRSIISDVFDSLPIFPMKVPDLFTGVFGLVHQYFAPANGRSAGVRRRRKKKMPVILTTTEEPRREMTQDDYQTLFQQFLRKKDEWDLLLHDKKKKKKKGKKKYDIILGKIVGHLAMAESEC